MTDSNPKISVIGCGNVGMRYAYALIIKGIVRELVLVDIDKDRLEGEVLDLSHTAPYTSPINIIAGDYEDIKNSDLIVITVGSKQKPGENRIELLENNVKLYKKIIPKIYSIEPNAIYLVVSNPVDIMSYVTYKISNKNSNEVLGSGTSLDTARFRYSLSKYCNVNAKNVHAYILGEHGDSEFPVWSSALVGGSIIKEYCKIFQNDDIQSYNEDLNSIFEEVRNSAYKIIEKKGETSYGIGLDLAIITKAIVNNENTILPVSTLIQDFYGVNDLFLSIPSVINRSGISRVLKIELNKQEEKEFIKSATKLKNIINKLEI